MNTGLREEYEAGDEEVLLPILRDCPPPCGSCPKGIDKTDPDNIVIGPDFNGDRIAWPSSIEALMMYRSIKLLRGAARVPAHLENCPVFHEVMLIVDQVVQLVDAERTQQLREDQEED